MVRRWFLSQRGTTTGNLGAGPSTPFNPYGADYAEWFERRTHSDEIGKGEVVEVSGGGTDATISKHFTGKAGTLAMVASC